MRANGGAASLLITSGPNCAKAGVAHESRPGTAGGQAETNLLEATDTARMPSLAASLRALMGLLSARRRWQLAGVIVLMLLGAMGELLTLGALLPLLAAMANPAGSPITRTLAPFLAAFGAIGSQQALYAFALRR